GAVGAVGAVASFRSGAGVARGGVRFRLLGWAIRAVIGGRAAGWSTIGTCGGNAFRWFLGAFAVFLHPAAGWGATAALAPFVTHMRFFGEEVFFGARWAGR
ncbi:MAG: hypothetical protein ACKV19_22290, partial [Verrucomicrobiales bacterium]